MVSPAFRVALRAIASMVTRPLLSDAGYRCVPENSGRQPYDWSRTTKGIRAPFEAEPMSASSIHGRSARFRGPSSWPPSRPRTCGAFTRSPSARVQQHRDRGDVDAELAIAAVGAELSAWDEPRGAGLAALSPPATRATRNTASSRCSTAGRPRRWRSSTCCRVRAIPDLHALGVLHQLMAVGQASQSRHHAAPQPRHRLRVNWRLSNVFADGGFFAIECASSQRARRQHAGGDLRAPRCSGERSDLGRSARCGEGGVPGAADPARQRQHGRAPRAARGARPSIRDDQHRDRAGQGPDGGPARARRPSATCAATARARSRSATSTSTSRGSRGSARSAT